MILRQVFENGYEIFTDLQNEFHLVRKESAHEEFTKAVEVSFTDKNDRLIPETYAFLFWSNGSQSTPLYKGFEYYILNSNGGEFKQLTFIEH